MQYENREGDEITANWEAAVARIKNTQSIAQKADIGQAYQWLSHTGGLTVGPSFKTITGVSFVESEPRLWLSGIVTDTKQAMPHEIETPSFIHPTTLDCLFQSALLSCSEALASSNANIPVGVDHIYIADAFQPNSGEEFAVHTETQWRNGKSRSRCIASNPSWTQPWITFEGVHLGRLPFNPNSQKKEEVTADSRYSSIIWDEHLESPIVTGQTPSDGSKGAVVETSDLQLGDWIKRLCHTNGDANALITTSSTNYSWVEDLEMAPGAGKRPCLGKLTVALCGSKDEDKSYTQKNLAGTQIVSLNTLGELPSSSLAEKRFDLVVIDELSLWEGKNSQAIASVLPALLEHGGFAAVRVSEENIEFAVKTLQQLDGLDVHSMTEDCNFIIIRKKPVQWATDPEIYILSPTDKSNSFPVFDHLEKIFATHNVRLISVGLDQVLALENKTVISLLDLAGPWVSEWTADDLKHLQELIRAQYVLWISPFWAQGSVENIGSGATGGLLRTLRNEHWNTTIPQLLVDAEDLQDQFGLACGILQVMQLTTQQSSRRHDLEYRLSNGRLLIPRVLETSAVNEAMQTLVHGPKPVLADLALDSRSLQLKIEGTKSIHWAEEQVPGGEFPPDHAELKVEMATIFDLNGDSGKSPETALPMIEVSGKVTRIGSAVNDLNVGDKVLTLSSAKSGLSTTICVPESDTIRIPANVDPEQVISTPLAYLNAYQILTEVGRLRSNSSVLLVGSIGQTLRAMIDYALAMDMHVIVATDSQNTSDILASRYPKLQDRILGIHGSLEASVSRLTNGTGVEAAIGLLGGYSGRVAASCLVQGGQYINLSSDMKLSALPESFIESGCTFSSPKLQRTFSEKPGSLHASVRHVIDFMKKHRMLEHVKPYATFPVADVQAALKHCKETDTRAIVNLQAPGQVPIVLPLPELATLPADHTYILAGGLGNLGLALAETLVQSGARHLVFLGRSGGVQHDQQLTLDLLRGRGCTIDVMRCDISRRGDIDHLESKIRNKKWTIGGVLQCTTVLKVINYDCISFFTPAN
jgi:NADPH:quinone reductase-like Zn-dependent oxidoreductase